MTEPVKVFEPTTPAPSTDQPVDKVLDALMARIRPASEAPIYDMMLLYGGPGVGKTTLAAKANQSLLVDAERGAESLIGNPECIADVMEFKSLTQLELLVEAIEAGKFPQYKVLIIDSGTVIQEIDLRQIVEKEVAKSSKRDNPLVPELQDYNQSTNQMKYIMSRLRDAPIHVIVIAQARTEKDDSTGVIVTKPGFTDKLNQSLNHLFSTVAYMSVDSGGNRTLQVHPTNRIVAKTRKTGLSPVISNPDINTLLTASNKDN